MSLLSAYQPPAPSSSSAGSQLASAAAGALTGGIVGSVIGAIGGLFSDTAHHNEKVQGHLNGYIEIYKCAAAGSLPAMRKLLWGKAGQPNGDYDEIKGDIAQMYAAAAAAQPAIAAQAVQMGGLSNDAQSLGSYQGCSANIGAAQGVGNPASIAYGSPVSAGFNTDPQLTGAISSTLATTGAQLASGNIGTWLAVLAFAGVAFVAIREYGRA